MVLDAEHAGRVGAGHQVRAVHDGGAEAALADAEADARKGEDHAAYAAAIRQAHRVGDQGGAPEAVRDRETAFVVDATELKNITLALEKLVINADMRLEMSEKAKAHANALLWPRQINRILAVAGI